MKILSGIAVSLLLLFSFNVYGNDWSEPIIDDIDGTVLSLSPSVRYPNSKLAFIMNPKHECNMMFVVITLLPRTFPETAVGSGKIFARARVDGGKIYEGPVRYAIENTDLGEYQSRIAETVPANKVMFEEMLRGQSLIFTVHEDDDTDEFSLIGLTQTYKSMNNLCTRLERIYKDRSDDWSEEPSQRKTPKPQVLPSDDHEWSA